MALNAKQNDVVDIIFKGHNLVVCGQAGTGKSYVLKEAIRRLKASGRKVAVTATTGVASQQFGHQAMTLHRWAGIHDGRYSSREMIRLLNEDEKFFEAKERIVEADVLILDEMSMLSSRMFALVEAVVREVRQSTFLFGGMQVIFAGDFYQLPPVKNALYDENGEFCYRSKLWTKVFPHTVELTDVIRQDEEDLVKAVNEAAKGLLSAESCRLFNSLKRPIHVPPGKLVVKLFATNQQVDVENTNSVLEWPGDIVTYKALDEGEKNYFKGILCPQTLHLKRGCPVMLLKNLSNVLVNGSVGQVVDFGKEGPIVNFIEADKTLELTPVKFSVYNPKKQTDEATRTQIPLKPAFAMTIHKSQGMTLDYVIIDCHMINRPGQFGVAVGRAKSTKGIQLLNFRKNCSVRQPETIEDFYSSIQVGQLFDNLSCCHTADAVADDLPDGLLHAGAEFEEEVDGHLQEVDSLDEADLLAVEQVLEHDIVEEEVHSLPAEYDVVLSDMIQASLYKPASRTLTDFQSEVNRLLMFWEGSDEFKQFVAKERHEVIRMISAHMAPGQEAAQKEQTAIYSAFATHVTSLEHRKNVCKLVGRTAPSEEEWDASYKIMQRLRGREIETMAKSMTAPAVQISVTRRLPELENLTDGGRGKIRYLGGFVVAKVRYLCQQQTNRLMFKLAKDSRERMRRAHEKVLLLSLLTMSESQAKDIARDQGSLNETSRRQGITQGLIHISDEGFSFFTNLCSEVISLQNGENFIAHGERFNHFILGELIRNQELRNKFVSLFSTMEYSMPVVEELFNDCVELFTRVMIKQFRKDYLAAVNKKKGMAHRKKVALGKQAKNELSYGDIVSDSTSGKSWSHQELKTCSSRGAMPHMKKFQLQNLCRAYAISYKTQETVPILREKLKDSIERLPGMPNPAVLGDTTAAGHSRQAGRKRRGNELDNICRECQQVYNEDEEWIECSACKRWFHRDCAEIFDNREWNDYTKEDGGSDFTCSFC